MKESTLESLFSKGVRDILEERPKMVQSKVRRRIHALFRFTVKENLLLRLR